MVIGAAAVILFVLYDANIAGNGERYGAVANYVILDNEWGTGRGYVWKLALKIYGDFPLSHKLFGYGPDTFGVITVQNFWEEMLSISKQKFENVHNEYLQYLITIGSVGLISYVSMLGTSLYNMIRTGLKRPVVMAFVFGVICYCVQAVVNISVPMVMPLVMLLIAIGGSIGRADS